MLDNIYDEISEYYSSTKILWGISDTQFTEFRSIYNRALVYAIPYNESIDLRSYREEILETLISECNEKVKSTQYKIQDILQRHSIEFFIPPNAQEDEIELKAKFSYKDAAVNAGLGWIGKNDLLITDRYGPRVRLSAILFNSEMNISNKTAKNCCPDNCNLCINACPYKLLTGTKWMLGMKRDSIIKYKKCNIQRSKYIEKYSRKSSCGLCLVSCPIGIVFQ